MRTPWLILVSLVVLVSLLAPVAGPAAAAPAPAPTADTWIAFSSLDEGYEGIWLVHPDGSGLYQLTYGADIYPTWSPDGSMLAYVHMGTAQQYSLGPGGMITGTAGSDIRVVDTSGKLLWTLGDKKWIEGKPTWSETDDCWQPQWSPDGQALAYATHRVTSGVLTLWHGRNTFYLSPSPQLVLEPEPHGDFTELDRVAMADLSWAPGPAPLWVWRADSTASFQLMAWDRRILQDSANAPLYNPRWSPSGQSLTVWQIDGSSTRNALVQLSTSGQVERTLFESNSLYLYNTAEWAPDGEHHLLGISSDWPAWFFETIFIRAAASVPPITMTAPLTLTVLPEEPPPDGYLYVLDQAGGKHPVVTPRRGTLDLISRQPWSSDGAQVVFVRVPYPGHEQDAPADTLGIYAGPPGRAQRIVPFHAADGFMLSFTYPAWQPSGEAPLPTPQPSPAPVGTATPPPTAKPTPTWTIAPTATRTRTAGPTQPPATATIPSETGAPPTPPPAAGMTDPLQFLIFGVLALAAGALVFLVLRRTRRQRGEPEPFSPRPSGRLLRGRQERPTEDLLESYTSRASTTTAAEESPPAETPAAAGPEGAAPAPTPLEPLGQPSLGAWPKTEVRAGAAQPAPSTAPVPAVSPEPVSPPAEPAAGPTPAPVQRLLEQGIAMVKAGKYADALATLRQMTYLDPENPEAWMWLGWAAAKQKDLAMAEHCFLQAQKLGYSQQAEQALAWLEKHIPRG
jgi:hypothetical protein